MGQLTIDHEIGRRLAEAGMARTLAAEPDTWIDGALDALRRFAAMPGWAEFKVEDFRAWYLGQQLPPPHDHHVWGAIGSNAARRGIIAFTGRYAPSVSPKTHGHPVKVWRAV
jgi:hypothetical protein